MRVKKQTCLQEPYSPVYFISIFFIGNLVDTSFSNTQSNLESVSKDDLILPRTPFTANQQLTPHQQRNLIPPKRNQQPSNPRPSLIALHRLRRPTHNHP